MALKVLAVDDSKTIRMIVKKAFKPFKCEFFEAENGSEGLSIAKREKPDLVILDITMPVMTGTEMLQKMKADTLLRDTPVIMLTAESGKENVMKIAKMGVNDYVVKPFKGDQLIDRVAKIFQLEEKTVDDEPVDTGKLYYTSDGDYNILTMPKKITRGISSDIEGHLDSQIKGMLDSRKNKFILDMCEVQEINISLIKLIVSVAEACNKANIDVRAAGTSILSDGLKEFAETKELSVSASVEQAKGAF